MDETQAILQWGVHGKTEEKTAIGRLYLDHHHVYYFPELPLKTGWGPVGFFFSGAALFLFGLIATIFTFASSDPWPGQGPGLDFLLYLPLLGLIFLITALALYLRETLVTTRARKHVLTEDEYLGMSLDDRYTHHTGALKFKRSDIASVTGTKTLEITTRNGTKLQLKSIPFDETLLEHLTHQPLPKEVIPSESTQRPASTEKATLQ